MELAVATIRKGRLSFKTPLLFSLHYVRKLTWEFERGVASTARSTSSLCLWKPRDMSILVDSRFCEWRAIAYDSSDLIEGECVGRDTAGKYISRHCFNTRVNCEVRDAVDKYLMNDLGSIIASKYASSPVVTTLPVKASPDTGLTLCVNYEKELTRISGMIRDW